MKLFITPVVISLAAFFAMWLWGGVEALLLTAALAALEISLSFDNAVLNAKILARMSERWQKRFLTWGMPVAVFGVRFILPVLIVAAAAAASPWTITLLALHDPAAYAALLEHASPAIHAFGGAFLLMVALKYFFDEEKEVHWLVWLEQHFKRLGQPEWLSSAFAVAAVVALALVSHNPVLILAAGLIGIGLYVLLDWMVERLGGGVGGTAAGLSLFIYLNILDAAFSLDGVVGAFALTTQILVILVGLGIGAYFVRSITIYLTRSKTIETFIYLEHGAHWAIFSLALCLFAGLFVQVPEVVPGTVGLAFAVLSYLSSRRKLR